VQQQVRQQQRAIPAAPVFDVVPTYGDVNWTQESCLQ
jgi:hypothetical protein